MPKVCINRPNRTRERKFTEKDAGRIVCRVLSEGGDPVKLRQEIEKCIDLCDKERIRQQINQILQAAIALSILLSTLLAAVTGIAVILSRIPFGRLLLPLLNRLTRAQQALESGRTIEGIARRILDELGPPRI